MPNEPTNDGQGASRPTILKIVSNSNSKIKSLIFTAHIKQEWENSENTFDLAFCCDHWSTSIKMHLLMCNLFNLPFTNRYSGQTFYLDTNDPEQFIDMMEVVLHPHNLDESALKELRSFFGQVLYSTQSDANIDKAMQLFEMN